jgi:hypothetical protein
LSVASRRSACCSTAGIWRAGRGTGRRAVRISEVLQERVADGGIRIRYQCSPYYTDTPLGSAAEQLRAAARIEADDPPATKLDKLEQLVIPSEGEEVGTVPLLAIGWRSRPRTVTRR